MTRLFSAMLLTAALAISACAASAPTEQAAPSTAWNAAALEEVVSYVASQKTTGFLIIEDGRTITEHNWPLPPEAETFRASFVHGRTPGGALREDVASQQKSLIALLVGIGVDKGLIDIEKPVSAYIGARWSKATSEQESAITVRNLLEMNSGLKEDLTFDAPAGAKFFYNTPAYAFLKPVLETASKQSLTILTQLWLTKVIDMHDTGWEQRPAAFADVGNPTGLVTTPRDLALLGQFVLNGGKKSPTSAQLISKQQLDAIFRPTATNPAYGRLWWLNGSAETVNVGLDSPRRSGQFIQSAPREMLCAMGAQDRKLFIVPSRKLLVIRMGQTAPDRDFNEKLWQLLTKAMPAH